MGGILLCLSWPATDGMTVSHYVVVRFVINLSCRICVQRFGYVNILIIGRHFCAISSHWMRLY